MDAPPAEVSVASTPASTMTAPPAGQVRPSTATSPAATYTPSSPCRSSQAKESSATSSVRASQSGNPSGIGSPGATMVNPRATMGSALAEAVEALGVPGEDEIALVAGHVGEVGVDLPPRVGPVGARVGEVARPHQPVDADGVPVVHGVVVGQVREPEVVVDVLARQLGEPGLGAHGPAAEAVVELLLDVGHPPGVDLGEDEPQI